MGRRHSIAARKASGDAKKSQVYAKIGKIIQIAAKKGADPSMNPALDLALQKARYNGLPKDVVEKAILKGSGQLGGEDLEEVVFEGYGPNGTAILIKTLTENTNRTSVNVRTILTKLGGSLGKPGSVARSFDETGVFVIDGKTLIKEDKGKQVEEVLPLDMDEAELELMDLAVKDMEIEDGVITVLTEKTDFNTVQEGLKNMSYHVIEGEIHFLPKDKINLSDEDQEKLQKIIENLEEDEDVDSIYHNGELINLV